jgi:hypothetical protein
LATLVPAPGRLVVEVTSRARAERARAFVEQLLGTAVRYRTTVFESLEAAMAKPRRRPDPRDTVPPEVEREIVGQLYAEHYRKWLDEPIPALGGRTPRHAARLKTARPAVVDLLKGLENQMERARQSGLPAMDVGGAGVGAAGVALMSGTSRLRARAQARPRLGGQARS